MCRKYKLAVNDIFLTMVLVVKTALECHAIEHLRDLKNSWNLVGGKGLKVGVKWFGVCTKGMKLSSFIWWDGPWNATYIATNILQLFAEWNLVVEALNECLKNSTQQNGIDKAEIVLYLHKTSEIYFPLTTTLSCNFINIWVTETSFGDSFKAPS